LYPIHYAIKQLVSNIKSAVTNTFNGTFKRFRIKFLKKISIFFKKSITIVLNTDKHPNIYNRVCPNILGEINYEYNSHFLEALVRIFS
jgi:hypothetical protein